MILSQSYENKILDLIRGQAISPISNLYLGLIRSDQTEVSGASYSRQNLPCNLITWKSTQGVINEVSSGATGEIKNAVPISWGTALETWGTVNTIRLYLGSTGTDYFADVSITPMSIVNGTSVLVQINDFTITTR